MIRAIACIFVVFTHSITNFLEHVETDLSAEGEYIVWIRFAILCATPIFILLSETLISKNYLEKLPKGFFIKRIKFILIPYILIGLLISYRDSEKTMASFIEIAIEKLLIGNWYGFFVLVIFQFYILHWCIAKYLVKVNPIIPLVVSFIISCTHIYAFVYVGRYQAFVLAYYPLSERTHILLWLFYFVVAFYVGRHYEEIMSFLSRKVWIPAIGVVGSYLFMMDNVLRKGYSGVMSERYDMLLYATSVFFLLLIIIRKYNLNSNLLTKISGFSYFIYLSHMLTLPFFAQVSLGFSENFFVYTGIMVFLTISTSIGWAFLFYNHRVTRLFTGKIKLLE